MTRSLTMAASILHLGYSWMLVLVGAAGIFSAKWELATIFGLDPARQLADPATLLNQYRFLKSVEFGAGPWCLAYRSDILKDDGAATLFLAIVGSGICARVSAWMVDGRPATAFLIFLLLEVLVFASVALHLRVSDG